MRDYSPPIYSPTECLNLKKLEAESRMLFLPGGLCGFLFFLLLLRCIPVMERIPVVSDREHTPHMILTFVTLSPPPEHHPSLVLQNYPDDFVERKRHPKPEIPIPVTLPSKREISPALPDSVPFPGLMVRKFLNAESLPVFPNLADSAAVHIPDSASIAIFEHNFHELSRRYGPFAVKKKRDIFKDINLGDRGLLRVSPGLSMVVLDLFPLEEKPVEDERRIYRQDLLGLSVGRGIAVGVGPGFIAGNALGLISTGRHLVKTIKWNWEDAEREKGLRRAREEGFSTVSGTELRFLILMWRDERLDPERLFRRDREFIAKGGPLGTRSYREFLALMEDRGLVVSLRKGGRLFHRANCTHEEILQTLTLRFGAPDDSSHYAEIRKSIDLITRCTDLSTGKMVLPEDPG